MDTRWLRLDLRLLSEPLVTAEAGGCPTRLLLGTPWEAAMSAASDDESPGTLGCSRASCECDQSMPARYTIQEAGQMLAHTTALA